MKQFCVAAGYGFLTGVVTALILSLMGVVSDLVWSGPDARWYVFLVIFVGGLLIAGLRHLYEGNDLEQQVSAAREPNKQKRRNATLLALMAIVAVGFGGAVGPEAGVLAVVAEMSALVAHVIARTAAEKRLVGEVGTAAALGGIYGSPPGGAAIAQEHPEAPKWQLYLAGLAGLLGFLFTAKRVLHGDPLRIHLAEYFSAGDGTDILWAIPPAFLGAAIGVVFLLTLPMLKSILSRAGGIVAQTLIGSTLFAVLAAAFPILRFSGHHELEEMLHWGQESGMGALLSLALLKVLALSLCLSSGWRGGAIFPLLFAGAAAGGAVLWAIPQIPLTVALVAGMTAAMTTGFGKPIAAILVAMLLFGPVAIWPLCVGALVGWGGAKLVPKESIH